MQPQLNPQTNPLLNQVLYHLILQLMRPRNPKTPMTALEPVPPSLGVNDPNLQGMKGTMQGSQGIMAPFTNPGSLISSLLGGHRG